MIPMKELLSGMPLSPAQIGVLLSLVHPPGLTAQNVASGSPSKFKKSKRGKLSRSTT
ncbi:hypothetical protein [Nonomuraea angiospora]|uniref:hypothetical protein n=1 Tax=Nonomuraea angiospora TaxID=46172 RepID=UPI0029BB7D21|nr:hypothetical protein [Nonomuraea angiospora]MDX3099728.1 hypothetical protein [Nonomuraea angiospora]